MPTLPTPTTLRARVDELELVEQDPALVRQREAVLEEEALAVGLEAVALLAVREVVEPDDQRRIGDDPPLAVDIP